MFHWIFYQSDLFVKSLFAYILLSTAAELFQLRKGKRWPQLLELRSISSAQPRPEKDYRKCFWKSQKQFWVEKLTSRIQPTKKGGGSVLFFNSITDFSGRKLTNMIACIQSAFLKYITFQLRRIFS